MPTVNEETLVHILRNKVIKEGLRPWCKQVGLDPGNVSNVMNKNRPMQDSIAKALGFEPMKFYVRIDNQ